MSLCVIMSDWAPLKEVCLCWALPVFFNFSNTKK